MTQALAPVRTPLLRDGALHIKAEARQRSGSAKYRMVRSRVLDAIRSGEITGGTTLVEVSSGSTGVALGVIGKLLGVAVEVHALRTIAPAKRRAIEKTGARLALYPPDVPVPRLLDIVRDKAAGGGYWHLNQYARGAAERAYEPLAREIVAQLGRVSPSVFLCPVGSGGLIQGVGAALRKEFPSIRIVALEPARGEAIDGIRNTELHHLGDADPYDRDFPDDVVRVRRPASRAAVRGVRLGESSSAALAAAEAARWGPTLILAPD